MKQITTLFKGLNIVLILCLLYASFISISAAPSEQMYYELRIYHVNQSAQAERVDNYLKFAYLPALHRAGIEKAGVFKPVEADTAFGKLIYVFIPFKTMDQYLKLPAQLDKDTEYQKTGKEFLDAPYTDPPYNRFESILMKAFTGFPQYRIPVFETVAGERIYELRSYESWTDAKAVKKIEMFNQGGEIKLFEKLGFNPVFFGEVLMGSHKPNLMYMTSFSDMKSNKELWTAFGSDPEWIKMKGIEEYKNTVIKPNSYLLHPTSYSDF
jgi:hypothetical protein